MNKRRPLCSLREARTRYGFQPLKRPRFVAEAFCEWCGQLLPRGRKNFCCDKCARLYDQVIVWKARGGYAQHIMRRDLFSCQDCGALHAIMNRHGLYVPASDGELDIHHILPVSQGGSDAPGNLVTLCKACHLARHAALREG